MPLLLKLTQLKKLLLKLSTMLGTQFQAQLMTLLIQYKRPLDMLLMAVIYKIKR
jgi:hypothetical protein